MDLFNDLDAIQNRPGTMAPHTPLAARMRPRRLDDFAGQVHIIGPECILRRAIEEDTLTSVIFYGPPGVGKSTLASIIANSTRSHFENFSAVTQGIPDLRKVIQAASTRRQLYGSRTVLFIDEIHRFNKAQQDALLPHVENGTVVLIGATTENPYFEVNAPLLSRARVFTFEPLSDADLTKLVQRAVVDEELGLGKLNLEVESEALEHLINKSNGDARTALNALELASVTTRSETRSTDAVRKITVQVVSDAMQRKNIAYDKGGDNHYDTISAFIKSIRGSDSDASLHYLAKMLAAGEDARFIARRLVILASEDIGNADPMGLLVANAAAHAVEYVGFPEAQLNLAQAVTYLATAPKSNAVHVALQRAAIDVANQRLSPPPKYIRDTQSGTGRVAKNDAPYLYPHDYPEGYVKQQYMPDGVQTQLYYVPTNNGHEATIKKAMEQRRALDRDESGFTAD